MENYTITIRTISPLCLGSGQADVNVDADIVHDKYGLPYFPGKRLRGLLYESALEVSEMAALCGQPFLTQRTVDELFHHVSDSPVHFIIPDFHLPDYEKMIEDWQVLQTTFKDTIRPENVLDYYTSLRFQTAIDEKTGIGEKTGIAKDHSLRNIRVLNRGITFKGTVSLINASEIHEQALALALQNLRRAGTNRNRGFGQIECEMDGQHALIDQAFRKGGNQS
ncbi:RAMP superfamily CRISPR-associated protein [Megasphaera elsdenii]|uniref:RAMP superfamily CRISPR-associated protein n=1 Tax=Megasphaera elsdenii TaxID=907 RepID=UPI0039F4AE49